MKYLLWEKLANYIANLDGSLHEKLRGHVGKTIRVKTTEPYHVFYMSIRQTDLVFDKEFDGDEHLRVRMPFRVLMYVVLGIDKFTPYNRDIKIEGDEDLSFDLTKALEGTTLWSSTKAVIGCFVPNFSSVEDLIRMAIGQEPEWVKRLEDTFGELPVINQKILSSLEKLEGHSEHKLFLAREISREVAKIRRISYGLLVILILFFSQYVAFDIFKIIPPF